LRYADGNTITIGLGVTFLLDFVGSLAYCTALPNAIPDPSRSGDLNMGPVSKWFPVVHWRRSRILL